jgi:hypothetical protein
MIALLIAASAVTVSPQLMKQGEQVFRYSACQRYTRPFDVWAAHHDINKMPEFERNFLNAAWDEGFKWGMKNRKRLTLQVCQRLNDYGENN